MIERERGEKTDTQTHRPTDGKTMFRRGWGESGSAMRDNGWRTRRITKCQTVRRMDDLRLTDEQTFRQLVRH